MKKLINLVFLFFLVVSCTFTTTKDVDLNPAGQELLTQIKSSYQFEDIKALSTSQSGSQKRNFVTLQLVNGQNLPSGSELSSLGANFASALVQVLDTPHHFKSISVVFMTKKGTSLSSTTTSTSFDYDIR